MRAKNVAILESRLGAQLVELVAQRGGVPFHAPALAELPDLDPAQIASLVASLEAQPAKLAVFQTGVGTRALFAATDALALSEKLLALLQQMVVVARGPKPGGALRARGVRIDRSAADPFTTREVLQAIADVPLAGVRAIVQRHGTVNVELDRALEARGASVVEIPTYRWSLPADTAPLASLIGALERGEMHAVVLTNAEQVRNLFAVARSLGRADALRVALNRTLVASIGPVASAALREAGVEVGLESRPPKLGALLSSLDEALS
jgi:uroporphyrinogen-III synthase